MSQGPGQAPAACHGKARCQQVPSRRSGAWRRVTLTIVQPKNDPGAQEGSQRLSQGVDGQLDPGLSRQEAHGKGHSRVQVGPCTDGKWNLLAIACHRGEARIPHHLHAPRLCPGEQGAEKGFWYQMEDGTVEQANSAHL